MAHTEQRKHAPFCSLPSIHAERLDASLPKEQLCSPLQALARKGMPMTKRFDVDKAIYGLKSFEIGFSMDTRFDAARPMGSVAMDLVSTVIKASLVGLVDDVKELLPRSVEWLRYAIANRESLGSVTEYHLSLLNQALAIAVWLQDGSISEEAWESALRNDQQAITISDKVYPAKDLRSARLDHVVAMAVLSGNYEVAVSEYESVLGAPTTRARARSVTPRRYAYEVAKARLGSAGLDDLYLLGEAMLSMHVEPYLAYGNYIEAATLVCLVRSKVEGSVDATTAMRSGLAR